MLRFIVVALCMLQVANSKEEQPSVTVVSPSGTYEGRVLSTSDRIQYNVFRGIPYAEPPIGELRFKKTVPLGKSVGMYSAIDEKPFCIQLNMPDIFGEGAEDCLYLNIFSPTKADQSKLKKVFVYIHGGGNINGMKDMYNPETLVAGNDIIVVTINYRLGLLGFLSSNTASARGKYGLWDQVEALRWVKKNIQAFGGDPNAVTVGGESAGGIDSTALSVCSESQGLFARIFPMSGAMGVEYPTVVAGDPLPAVEKFARRENCLAEKDLAPQSDEEWSAVVECLRKLPADRFSSMAELGDMSFIGPVIDGDYFPKPLKELYADTAYLESIGFHDRDYLVSICHNEGDVFNILQDEMKAAMTQEQLESMPPNAMWHGMIDSILSSVNIFGPLSPEVITRVAEWYEENYEINPMADFGADSIFHIPGNEYINAVSRGWSQDESRLHFLRFVHYPEFLTGPYKGMLHGIDLFYLFDFEDIDILNKIIDYKINGSKWNQSDKELREKYTSLVASFVKTGKPSAGPKVEWPAYTPKDGHYLEFGESPRVLQHLKSDRVKLFHQMIPAWIKEFPYTAPETNTPTHAETNTQTHADDEL